MKKFIKLSYYKTQLTRSISNRQSILENYAKFLINSSQVTFILPNKFNNYIFIKWQGEGVIQSEIS